MKIPTPKKLPSGSWYARVTIDGTVHCITRSTRKEVEQECSALKLGLKKAPDKSSDTLSACIDKWIDLRGPSLSPSTIRTYRIIQKNRLQSIMERPVKSLTDEDLQIAVNEDLKTLSAKTMKNTVGFLSSIMHEYAGREIKITLPQIIRPDREFLQPEQIPLFLKAMRGNTYELPALLALHGLRASEIMGLQRKDLRSDRIVVHGSAVPDEFNIMTRKETNKNTSSRRTVPVMIPRLAELAAELPGADDDYIFTYSSTGSIYNGINRVCRKEGLPEVGIHGLRHSFASLCYHKGISEEICMKLGGWSDVQTMRKIYTHIAESDEMKGIQALKAFFD